MHSQSPLQWFQLYKKCVAKDNGALDYTLSVNTKSSLFTF